MKTYQIPLTEQEIDVILKVLDKAQTVGIETQRVVVRLADKIVSVVRSAEATAKVETKAPESTETPKPKEN